MPDDEFVMSVLIRGNGVDVVAHLCGGGLTQPVEPFLRGFAIERGPSLAPHRDIPARVVVGFRIRKRGARVKNSRTRLSVPSQNVTYIVDDLVNPHAIGKVNGEYRP